MTVRFALISLLLSSALAGCATPGGYYDDRSGYAQCGNCGTVEKIERVYGERQATGGGAVLGAIIGGVLGNQVGSGSGKKAATVVGAVAGGVAGNAVEKDVRSAPRFELFVRMDDGRRLVVEQRELDGIRDGDRVLVSGGRARLL